MDKQVGARRFGSLGEGPFDHRLGRDLFDRVTEETIDWTSGQLDALRTWIHELRWNSPRDPVSGFKMGKFDGLPRDRDAYSTVQYLSQFEARGCEFVLILRDEDGDPAREQSIRTGVDEFSSRFRSPLRVLVGCPRFEGESWVLSGFVARDGAESQRVAEEKTRLGLDPTLEPERLTAKKDHELRSAKRVLASLCNGDHKRTEDCWRETPLDVLRERGASNGLANFLADAARIARHVYDH
ncbi:MAG: hypothetical protein ACOZQL_18895 [Myxococcota bacterium]